MNESNFKLHVYILIISRYLIKTLDKFIVHLKMELLHTLGGCPYGPDEMWKVTWPATNVSTTARQKCPGGSESQGITCTTSYVSESSYYNNIILIIICCERLSLFQIITFIPKNIRSYQLLQAFVVSKYKNLPNIFHGCKVIHKKCQSFSPRIINNIQYLIFSSM